MKRGQILFMLQTDVCNMKKVVGAAFTRHAEKDLKSQTTLVHWFGKLSNEKGECH